MAHDARIWPQTKLVRMGDYVFTYVEFYGVTTTAYSELFAYNSSGTMLYYPFTAPNSLQSCTASAILTYGGWVYRQIGVIWAFKNATFAAQAVNYRLWLWMDGSLYDSYQTF